MRQTHHKTMRHYFTNISIHNEFSELCVCVKPVCAHQISKCRHKLEIPSCNHSAMTEFTKSPGSWPQSTSGRRYTWSASQLLHDGNQSKKLTTQSFTSLHIDVHRPLSLFFKACDTLLSSHKIQSSTFSRREIYNNASETKFKCAEID